MSTSSSSNPGTGARLQLAAVGPMDVHLRGPFSQFSRAYKRSTRFSTWTHEIPMKYTPGKRSQVTIPKNGDLLADVYLEVTLPAVPDKTWVPSVGYALLRRVRLLLNDAEVHNYERLWFDLYDRLHTAAGHERGLSSMVGRAAASASARRTLHLPLRLLTCRKGSPRAPLPLQALRTGALKLDVEFELPGALLPGATDDPGIQVKVLCDFVELDEPERREVMRGGMLAYETVIDSDALSYKVDSTGGLADQPDVKVNLSNVRFPVKYLAWVAYEENGSMFVYLPDPIRDVSLLFNNQRRLDFRTMRYFDTVQKYQHFRRLQSGPPGVYSFAMDATSRHHTGTADFGAMRSVQLQATVVPGNPRFKLKVFSSCYNFLEINGPSTRVVLV